MIADILKCKLLPYCTLVVSSCPHAIVQLRERATVRVDILGFTEAEQDQFIEQALKEQTQSIKELTQYLKDHFAISSLRVATWLSFFSCTKTRNFPSSSTDLYNRFVCLTVCRHLAKYGHPLDNAITDLNNLPDPYSKIIQNFHWRPQQ